MNWPVFVAAVVLAFYVGYFVACMMAANDIKPPKKGKS